MAKDNRKKGCPNLTCQFNKEKKKQKADMCFCPKCGTPLVYVCAKCFNEIEDLGPEHRICAHCEAVGDDHMERIKDGLKTAGRIGGTALLSLGTAIGAKAYPKVKKIIIEKGSKVVVDVAKHVIK